MTSQVSCANQTTKPLALESFQKGSLSSDVAASLSRVRDRISEAAQTAGRDPNDVILVAVTKGVEVSAIREAIAAGQTEFGENRAQELLAKVRAIQEPVRWHFIGRLQTNKVKDVVGSAYAIHSIDRLALAQQIGQTAPGRVRVLLQVNTSGEQTKAGVAPEAVPETLAAMLEIQHLDPVGLMTMGPHVASEIELRDCFRQLARLRDQAAQEFGSSIIRHLSMGMSQDYGVAIQEGATMVRIGSAIFGPRGPMLQDVAS